MPDFNGRLQCPSFYDAVVDERVIYFPMAQYNALCKGTLSDSTVKILDIFPKLPIYIYCPYKGIYKYKDYLLLAPHENTNINKDLLIYDIENCSFLKIENKKKITFYSNVVFEYKEYLYIVSQETGEICKLDFKNRILKDLSCDTYKIDDALVGEVCRVDECIYIPINKRQIIRVFNLYTEQMTHYAYPSNISFIQTLRYGDGKFWITTSDDKKLYTWRREETWAHETGSFPCDVNLFHQGKRSVWFGRSFIYENYLWLFPVWADAILKYNIKRCNFEKFEIEGEEDVPDKIDEEIKSGKRFLMSKYSFLQKYDNKVFFQSSKTRILYELNLQSNNICKYVLRVDNIFKNRIYPSAEEGIMYEVNYTNGLEDLFKSFDKKDTNIVHNMENNIGQSINGYINSQMIM